MKNFSFQNMSQVLHFREADLEGLRELLDEIALLGTGFGVDEGHHDQALHQLISDLLVRKRPGQFDRRDWSELLQLMGCADNLMCSSEASSAPSAIATVFMARKPQ